MRLRTLIPVLLLAGMALVAQAQNFPGTVPSVTTINTQKLLSIMNMGSGGNNFIPVAAHRGYWRNVPENSTDSIEAAYNAGIEVVEIDVRLASDAADPFKDANAAMVLSHDECVDRQTNGSGSLSRNTKQGGCPSSNGMTGASYQNLQLRGRNGLVVPEHPISLAESLQTLMSYQHVSNGVLYGPVLIVDLKDKDNAISGITSKFAGWQEYQKCLAVMQTIMPTANMPAVLFKLKMASALPSASAVQTEIATHPSYGHVILTIVPEDLSNQQTVEDDVPDVEEGEMVQAGYGPSGTSYTALLALSGPQSPSNQPFVQQFEFVPFNANDGMSAYLGAGFLHAFATYYQPNSMPEGVTDRFASCCVQAPLINAETSPPNDYKKVDIRGVLDFATNYGRANNGLITSDTLRETLNYLALLGQRNFAAIQ